LLLEPGKYYSTIYFWNDESNEFLCYYINFQLPFHRSHCGVDTLDLDLDLIINPDFSYRWKDVDDYQKAIENEIIFPEWVEGIESARQDVLEKLETRRYPFDGSWLNWKPDPSWSPPKLPENWDKI
jgi:predicted RNA-binding protein associated with RNAse of E/G family